MPDYKLFEAEYRMMNILWDNEPLSCSELAQLCDELLGWKRTTTYTQIKRMEERQFIRRDGSILTALVKRNQVEQFDSEEIVDGRFNGSLPKFVAAFIGSKRMTKDQIDELRRMLDEFDGEQ